MAFISTTALIVVGAIVLVLYLFLSTFGSKLIPKKHSNIPMAPHYSSFFGHTKYFTSNYDRVNDGVFDVLSLCKSRLVCMWSAGRNLVYILDPKLAKWVFEQEFSSFEKGRSGAERYHELLGDGIFLSDPGHGWKFQRKIASRMFSMRNLRNYMYECCVNTTSIVMKKLDALLSSNCDVVDINDMLGRMTLDCFTSIAFGHSFQVIDLYPKRHPFSSSFDSIISRLGRRGHDPFWKIKRFFNLGNEAKISKDLTVINSFANKILSAKHSNKNKNKNKNLRGEYGAALGAAQYDLFSLFMEHDSSLTLEQLRHISMNFVIAGRDTTRILLSWFLYLLDLHPAIKRKVQIEIAEVANTAELNELNYSHASKSLKYLEACLLETMRLYPPVPFLARKAKANIRVPGDENYMITKGDLLIIHAWTYGRLDRLYENALQFQPERWIENGINSFDTCLYPIFNIAPRMCLGKQFALLEAKVFVYEFLRTFDYSVCKNQVITYVPSAVLNMKNGMKINIVKNE